VNLFINYRITVAKEATLLGPWT